MTALERIKETEEGPKDNGTCRQCGYDGEFLLKAFNVMRGIACQLEQDNKIKFEDDNLKVPIWIYVEKKVDEEFEERMRGKSEGAV